MNLLCWENWISYFESNGYHCLAPAWPGHDKSVDSLRKQEHDPQLAILSLKNVIRQYSDVIHSLPEKPILIGHSMGGCISFDGQQLIYSSFKTVDLILVGPPRLNRKSHTCPPSLSVVVRVSPQPSNRL
jgi:pimeloyl-ACP methyl ester carboxylesterase